ncbi:MAG: hypothetical protein K2Y23_05285 [Cyanobacteria bacterium]|nr:hypothetical protein [Cyanobacteriota bacterium]
MANDDEPLIPDDRPPSVACPHCAAHTARPVSVATDKRDPTIVNITMQCRDCLQSWIVPKLAHDIPA